MKHLRSLPIAIGLVALSAGVVLAFEPLPDQAGTGLDRATEANGKTLPARPASIPGLDAVVANVLAAIGAVHGIAVSAAATAEDVTPDTNHGQDVSTVARDNHGQATAVERRPADVDPPRGAAPMDDSKVPDKPGGQAPGDVGRP